MSRELDAQIAVEIFGCKLTTSRTREPFPLDCCGCDDSGHTDNQFLERPGGYLKSYSEDIQWAIEILELADGAWAVERYRETDHKLYFKCYIRFGDSTGTQWGCSSPAEAICRAALRAKAGQALTEGKSEA